jgi:hypothetical protein
MIANIASIANRQHCQNRVFPLLRQVLSQDPLALLAPSRARPSPRKEQDHHEC